MSIRKFTKALWVLFLAVNLNPIYAQEITDCAVVTARSGSRISETAVKATDHDVLTKWHTLQTRGTIWFQYQFCNNASHSVNSYAITSANDMPLRDPRSIALYGSNDGTNYTLIDSRRDVTFDSRFQTLRFNFPNNTQYSYYRFEFVANPGNDGVQVAELTLFENGAVVQDPRPAAPSGVTTYLLAPESVGLSWVDNSEVENSFIIEMSTSSSFSNIQSTFTATANTSRYLVNGLHENTTYYFRVKAVNENGSSGYSQVLAAATIAGTGTGTGTGTEDIFPLTMNGGKLSTSSGKPFLIIGDSPWYLISGPGNADVDKYLENRRQKGFNSMEMNLVASASEGWLDPDGNKPFLVDGDFSTPNPKYFDHVDYVLGKAREKGIVVFLYPVWLGYDTGFGHPEGYFNEVKANGPAKMYQYGSYLGHRYRNFKNIIWVMGGDCSPAAVMDEIRETVKGIEDAAGPQIFSVHNARFHSGITEYPGEKWIDLNNTYSDYSAIGKYLVADYNRNYPFYFIEGTYENTGISAVSLRSQMYKPVLMGANGSFYGHHPLYDFDSGWDNSSVLESQGANDVKRSAQFFSSRSWYNLVPDISHAVLTNGAGDILAGNYAAAAIMKDGSTAIIYSPDRRQLTVDLTKISGSQTHGWWYQPSNGNVTDLSVFDDSQSGTFTPPSDGDWLLVLDDASRSLGSPGLALKSTEGENSSGTDAADIRKAEPFIYPNPAIDGIFIENLDSPDTRVIVYDIDGKVVLDRRLETNYLDISDFSRGIYVVKLVEEKRTSMHRFIKE
jgi:hypothetical protein